MSRELECRDTREIISQIFIRAAMDWSARQRDTANIIMFVFVMPYVYAQ